MTNTKLIQVKVRDTHTVLFEGEVDRISSFNEMGTFDVFPMHANFISILHKKLTFHRMNKIVKEFVIDQAVMKVKKDSVHIFLGIEAFVLDAEENQPNSSESNTKTTAK